MAIIIGALTIMYYHQYWVVPVLSLLIAVYIGWESWKVVQEAINILLFKILTSISMTDLQLVLGQISNVNNIHLWQLDKHNLHVKVDDVLISSTAEIAKYMEEK